MNAVLDQLKHYAAFLERITGLFDQEVNAGVKSFDADLLKQALVAISRRLRPDAPSDLSLKEGSLEHQAEMLLMKDRELVLAICALSPSPTPVTYLYLRAFSIWNQVADNGDEVHRLQHFALALIFIAYEIRDHLGQPKLALEELAHQALETDIMLREALPELLELKVRALCRL